MSNSKLLVCSLFLFFSFASSSYFNTTLTTVTATNHQCSALLLFKQNLSSFNFSIDDPPFSSPCQDWLGSEGYYPLMINWNTSATDCCDWDGVTCDHSTGDVIGLDLSCGMLQGTLHPNTSLFNLPRLRTLNLAFNYFGGSQLPREIGRFSNTLTHLNISNCWFSGQVPAESTLLHKLVSLDLSQNYGFDVEPHVFINLLQNYTSLEQLSLQEVYISSVLPAHLNISSSLKLLNLQNTGLHGKLPHYIFNLQSLEKLYLGGSSLKGKLPANIFNTLLTNFTHLRDLSLGGINIGLVLPTYLNISSSLKSLDLINTGLKGKLPDNIFGLQFLEVLYLSENSDLIGPLPIVNATMPPLTELSLRSTSLSGEIPDSIGHLNSLTYLDLSNCSFTGPLPKSIVNLSHLTFLHLSSNKLNGTLPSSLFSLRSLQGLSLEDNQFDGPILQSFPQLTNLIYLYLSYNNFSGDLELDTFLSGLTIVLHLDVSYSGLSVTTSNGNHHVSPNFMSLRLASCKIKVFPEVLRSMRNLLYLDLSGNEIHGQIPQWAGEIGGSGLYHLNFSHNFITGLPQFQWQYRLQALYLQSNMIQGPFPSSVCNLSDVRYLDLSNNSFHGVIPQCVGNITSSLLLINLRNNLFQGSIPNVYGKCGGLEGLILNGNKLEGDLSSSWSKCKSLKVLDMGNNNLTGTFPSWLESLPKLQVLILRSNNFHGRIVPSSAVQSPFQTLRVLDLSHNGFVGHLPTKYFQNFNAMKNVVRMSTKPEYLQSSNRGYYSIIVAVKGNDQEFPKLFVGYTIVDLSSNNFEGEIPNIIGTLNSLKSLNLSHNNLIGQIPDTLGNLSDIESLDLSWNRLTGEIPRSLTDIEGLAALNLSQNNLRGRIPKGNQFNTFNENSFGGNLGLCGFPLHNECEHRSSPEAESDGDADEENGMTWKAVMLGYGCGTLLGLVIGYLMLSTGKPKWFNAIADKGEHLIQIRRNKKKHVYIGK